MTGLTTIAMLAVMLLHAFFGCCWHHSHDCCAQFEPASNHHHCGHDHEEHEGHQHPGPSPNDEETPAGGHEHRVCCGDHCEFVKSAEIAVPAAELGLGGLFVDNASCSSVAIRAAFLARSDHRPSASSPAMRLLPLLCVWRL